VCGFGGEFERLKEKNGIERVRRFEFGRWEIGGCLGEKGYIVLGFVGVDKRGIGVWDGYYENYGILGK
jgi:hypothetical protein